MAAPMSGPSRGFVWTAMTVGIVGILAAAGMAYALATNDGDDGGGGGSGAEVTASGFIVEQPGAIGPDAFTHPVDTTADHTCDKAALLRELRARPDAYREWGGVLGVPEADIPTYIESLRPYVLTVDTPVTNHGLHAGHAYARPSLLVKGTAVLMDDHFPYDASMTQVTVSGNTATSTIRTKAGAGSGTSSTAPTTTTSVPSGVAVPVTRCRCGNPLLPPYQSPPSTTTTTTLPTTTTTRRPPPRTTTTSQPPPSTTTTEPTTTTTSPTQMMVPA